LENFSLNIKNHVNPMLADAFELRNFLEMSSKQLMKISFAKEN
jgi:hypothetical protein